MEAGAVRHLHSHDYMGHSMHGAVVMHGGRTVAPLHPGSRANSSEHTHSGKVNTAMHWHL